jgi:PadR family transcriptional regulator PadR
MRRCEHRKKEFKFGPGFWLRAWILIILQKKELHGYELMTEINEFLPGFASKGPGDMGRGYRILRMLEEEELITSRWETEETGPARRVYSLTQKGEIVRENIIDYIKQLKQYTDKFINLAEK